MQTHHYHFRPRLIPTLATLLLLPILINMGLWQSRKADQKLALQQIYDSRETLQPLKIGAQLVNPDEVQFSKIVVRGSYDPAQSILLDNQIYQGKVGYQVITPLQIEGSAVRILVYRGWVPVGEDRRVLPDIVTPQGVVELNGYAYIPSNKYLELGSEVDSTQGTRKIVWQNLDLKRYAKTVSFTMQPIAVQLDPASTPDGLVRDWPRPDLHIEVNRGYAFQWFAMSVALVLIYLFTNIKRTPR